MSRLSRAVWCLIPVRASFRPDGSMTRFGRWSFRRITKKLPKRDFIGVPETHEVTARNVRIHADHIARQISDGSLRVVYDASRKDEGVVPIQRDRPAP